jgi:hypothetical protein
MEGKKWGIYQETPAPRRAEKEVSSVRSLSHGRLSLGYTTTAAIMLHESGLKIRAGRNPFCDFLLLYHDPFAKTSNKSIFRKIRCFDRSLRLSRGKRALFGAVFEKPLEPGSALSFSPDRLYIEWRAAGRECPPRRRRTS